MKPQWEVGLIWGWLALYPCYLFGQPDANQRRPRITVVVCDLADVNPESQARARQTVLRIMRDDGVEAVWINAGDVLKAGSPPAGDSSQPTRLPANGYFAVVITPHAPSGSRSTETGFAAVSTGPYRRAYVYYDRVKTFSYMVDALKNDATVGVVLGHVIAHELGHLLLPGDVHSMAGIMRGEWGYLQWKEASAGNLLFRPEQGKRMREQLPAD